MGEASEGSEVGLMEKILDDLAVSRETIGRLIEFNNILRKWNPKINLVSKGSLSDAWERHVLDSAQIFCLAPEWLRWGDLGSGGGFPGLVVAILAQEKNPNAETILVESDGRKAAFLREVSRELVLNARIVVERIETTDPLRVDVVSARALASLDILLGYSSYHVRTGGTCLFFKGESWQKEVEDARRSWSFSVVPHMSKTDSSAALLEVKEINRV